MLVTKQIRKPLKPHTPFDTGFSFLSSCLGPNYQGGPTFICTFSHCLSLEDAQSQLDVCNKWMCIFLFTIHWLVSKLGTERWERKRSGNRTWLVHLCRQGTIPNALFLVITDNKTDPWKWPLYITSPPESIFLTLLSAQRPYCFVVLTEEIKSD